MGVLTGAVGAHALGKKDPKKVDIWKTGSQYQLYHSLALALVPLICKGSQGRNIAGSFFTAGISLFSGACYLYVGNLEREHKLKIELGAN